MSLVGSAVEGVTRPLTDTAGNIIHEIGETRRNTVTQQELSERSRHEVTRNFNAGSAFWRPVWMFTTIGCIAIYVIASVYFYLQWLEGLQTGQSWAVGLTIVEWRIGWITLGGSLFTFATASFLGYSPFRSLEKSTRTLAGTSLGEQLGRRLRNVVQRDEPEIIRREASETPREIERLDGVIVPKRAKSSVERLHGAVEGIEQSFPDLGFYFGKTSKRRLARAHPDLQRLFNWAITRTPHDFAILETTRTMEKQQEYYRTGKSRTLDSAHVRRPSYAVDFVVLDPATGKADLNNIELYIQVLRIIKSGSKLLNIPITSGGLDWGWDYYHVELSRAAYSYPSLDEPEINLS